MKNFIKTTKIIIIGGFLMTSCKDTNIQKKEVTSLLKSIETSDPKQAGYINPNKYIQHNLGVADALAGFGELLKQLPSKSAKVNTIRVF
jgi:hypothetical protein